MTTKRCPNGFRKNKSGECTPKGSSTRKRCPKGTRKNKHGECVSKNGNSKSKKQLNYAIMIQKANLELLKRSEENSVNVNDLLRLAKEKLKISTIQPRVPKHFLDKMTNGANEYTDEDDEGVDTNFENYVIFYFTSNRPTFNYKEYKVTLDNQKYTFAIIGLDEN